jgi:hypothetical protein
MESQIQHTFDEDSDFVPVPIKIVIIWFYLLAAWYFSSVIFEFFPDRVFQLGNLLMGLMIVWTAYGLGYKRNYSRIAAIVIAGWWLLSYTYLGLQLLAHWQETSRVAEFYFRLLGKEYTGAIAVTLTVLANALQVFTIVTLFQPQTRKLFIKSTKQEK